MQLTSHDRDLLQRLYKVLTTAIKAHKEYKMDEQGNRLDELHPHPASLTLPQIAALIEIALHEGRPITHVEAAGNGKTAKSRNIDAICEGRPGKSAKAPFYVEKRDSEQDTRAKALHTTPIGQEYVRKLIQVMQEVCDGYKKD